VVLRVSGQELKAVLEYGLSELGGGSGRFPQVSGLRLTYNPLAPVGQRITSLLVQDRPVGLETVYTLATIDFLAAGGDGYVVFKEILDKGGRTQTFYSEKLVRDMVIDYIREKKDISASVGGRIQALNN
jgi:2',3'-cyclic-nucleotide 2'-phosphodiesterase (5'-nucleotidase family)